MPKIGMEPIRRAALIDATIACVGRAGTLDVTVGQIARAAGVSSGLAHHYFGSKDHLFLAAMRHVLKQYGADVRAGLVGAEGPRGRLDAILVAGFAPDNFSDSVIAAWLNFYVLAQTSDAASRLLRLYQRRLRSNLLDALRPLLGDGAEDAAERIAGLIDGLYLRHALNPGITGGADALRQLRAAVALELGEPA